MRGYPLRMMKIHIIADSGDDGKEAVVLLMDVSIIHNVCERVNERESTLMNQLAEVHCLFLAKRLSDVVAVAILIMKR